MSCEGQLTAISIHFIRWNSPPPLSWNSIFNFLHHSKEEHWRHQLVRTHCPKKWQPELSHDGGKGSVMLELVSLHVSHQAGHQIVLFQANLDDFTETDVEEMIETHISKISVEIRTQSCRNYQTDLWRSRWIKLTLSQQGTEILLVSSRRTQPYSICRFGTWRSTRRDVNSHPHQGPNGRGNNQIHSIQNAIYPADRKCRQYPCW